MRTGEANPYRFHHVLILCYVAYRRLLKMMCADLHAQKVVWTDAAAGRIGEHEAVIVSTTQQAYRYRVELGTADDHTIELGRRAG